MALYRADTENLCWALGSSREGISAFVLEYSYVVSHTATATSIPHSCLTPVQRLVPCSVPVPHSYLAYPLQLVVCRNYLYPVQLHLFYGRESQTVPDSCLSRVVDYPFLLLIDCSYDPSQASFPSWNLSLRIACLFRSRGATVPKLV